MTEAEMGGLPSSHFFWNNNAGSFFVKYQAKAKKTVFLHQSPDVDQTMQNKKPEMILFYNKNKGGVDCCDQMACLYTTQVAIQRWPIAGHCSNKCMGTLQAFNAKTN